MNYKKYLELVAGIVFIIIAVVHVFIDKPAIYIPSVIFGVIFVSQGVKKLRKP